MAASTASASLAQCVETANVREYNRYLLTCHHIDKAKIGTTSAMDFQKKLISMRMERIKKQADELKEKRRIEEEKRKKLEEERERLKNKNKGKIPFAKQRRMKMGEDDVDIPPEALAELLEGLEFDDVEVEGAPPGEDDGDDSPRSKKLPKHKRKVVFKEDAKEGPDGKPEAAPIDKLRLAVSKISKGNMFTQFLAQQIHAGQEPEKNNTEEAQSGMNVLRLLSMKMKAAADANEKKNLLERLKNASNPANAAVPAEPVTGKNRLSQIMTANFKKILQGGAADPKPQSTVRKAQARKLDPLILKLNETNIKLPPLWTVEVGELQDRNWGQVGDPPFEPTPLTDEDWNDVRYCQYIRWRGAAPDNF